MLLTVIIVLMALGWAEYMDPRYHIRWWWPTNTGHGGILRYPRSLAMGLPILVVVWVAVASLVARSAGPWWALLRLGSFIFTLIYLTKLIVEVRAWWTKTSS